MTELPPTVFIVDDDASVRRSMERLIKSAGHNVQSFDSAAEFLNSGHRQRVSGCLLLDISMPGINGLELHRTLAANRATLPVIFITGHGDIPMTVQAMKAGAVDFLVKPVKSDALLQAVELAIARNRRDEKLRSETETIQNRITTLTPREHEVMMLVVKGLLNKQIAEALGAAEKTIKVHRGRVMRKMEVQSVAELVRDVERGGMNGSKASD